MKYRVSIFGSCGELTVEADGPADAAEKSGFPLSLVWLAITDPAGGYYTCRRGILFDETKGVEVLDL